MIKQGQRVYIRPEWQDSPRDAVTVYIAVDDEEKGRVTIEAQLGLPINPQHTVTVDMIEVR